MDSNNIRRPGLLKLRIKPEETDFLSEDNEELVEQSDELIFDGDFDIQFSIINYKNKLKKTFYILCINNII